MITCHFFFSSRRRHTRWNCDWSSDVCSSDLDECPSALAFAKFDLPVGHRKQRVILSHPDIASGIPPGAALAHDDVAGEHALAAELLDPEALAFRVAAVARRAACFFVSHDETSFCCGLPIPLLASWPCRPWRAADCRP